MSVEGIAPIGSGATNPVPGAVAPPGGADVGGVARAGRPPAVTTPAASSAAVPDSRPPATDRVWAPAVPWSSVDDMLGEISRLLARAGDLLGEVRGAPPGSAMAARAELAEVLDQVSVLVRSLTRLAVPPAGSAGGVAGAPAVPAVTVAPGVPVPLLDADGRPVAGVMVVSLEQIAVAVALTATDADGPYLPGSDGARRLAAALGVDLAASGLGSVIGVVVDEADGQITGIRLLLATGPGGPGAPGVAGGAPLVTGGPAGPGVGVPGAVSGSGGVAGSGVGSVALPGAGGTPTGAVPGPVTGGGPPVGASGAASTLSLPGATAQDAALGVNLRSLPSLSELLGGAAARGSGAVDVAAALVAALRAQGPGASSLGGSLAPAGLALLDLLSAQEAASAVSGQIVGQAGTSLLAQVGNADRQAFVLLLFGGLVAPTTPQPRPVEPKRPRTPPEPDPDNDRGRDEGGEPGGDEGSDGAPSDGDGGDLGAPGARDAVGEAAPNSAGWA